MLELLSDQVTKEILESPKFPDKEIYLEYPYEYISTHKLPQYTQIFPNGSFLDRDILFKFNFLIQNQKQASTTKLYGEYQIEMFNTLPDQSISIKQIVIRVFSNDQKLYKNFEINNIEIKPLQSTQFSHKYPCSNDPTHMLLEIYGHFYGQSTIASQKDILKMQAFIKQTQDQIHQFDQVKNSLDVLNMFQNALSSARSGPNSQRPFILSYQFSTLNTKLVKKLEFDEHTYEKVQDPSNFLIVFEKQIEIRDFQQYLYQFQPYIHDENEKYHFNYFECQLEKCDKFKFFILLETYNSREGFICVFFNRKQKLGMIQLQLINSFAQQFLQFI
ncbi:hypothetical protein pb186bvf_006423 [Paramecium bursaria]